MLGKEEIYARRPVWSCFARWVFPEVGYPVRIMSWVRGVSNYGDLGRLRRTYWHGLVDAEVEEAVYKSQSAECCADKED